MYLQDRQVDSLFLQLFSVCKRPDHLCPCDFGAAILHVKCMTAYEVQGLSCRETRERLEGTSADLSSDTLSTRPELAKFNANQAPFCIYIFRTWIPVHNCAYQPTCRVC